MEKLDIKSFKDYFSDYNVILVKDIEDYYRIEEPTLSKYTINSRIRYLVNKGVIQRVGNGKYKLGRANIFIPDITTKSKLIDKTINKALPFIKYCQWDLSSVNLFSQHLINFNIHFVDVERDAIEPVYLLLKEKFQKVIMSQNLYDNLNEFDDFIIIRPLTTKSPMQKINNIYVAKLEKILVDLAVDKEFISFQGNELYHIFENSFKSYTINQQKMLSYAARKNRKEEIEIILKDINHQQNSI